MPLGSDPRTRHPQTLRWFTDIARGRPSGFADLQRAIVDPTTSPALRPHACSMLCGFLLARSQHSDPSRAPLPNCEVTSECVARLRELSSDKSERVTTRLFCATNLLINAQQKHFWTGKDAKVSNVHAYKALVEVSCPHVCKCTLQMQTSPCHADSLR